MATTHTPADFLAAAVPTVRNLTAETETETRGTKTKTAPAAYPIALTADALARVHAASIAEGCARVVFGLTADRTAAVSVILTPCHRVARDGRLTAPELSAVSPYAGDAAQARLRAIDGRAVSAGRVISAPTAGDAFATKCATAWLVGPGFDGPTAIALTPASDRTSRTAETAHAVMLTGRGEATAYAVAVSVRVMRGGDTWSVSARVYSGGRLPDATIDAVAIADAPGAPDAPATADALATIVTPAKPRRKRAPATK